MKTEPSPATDERDFDLARGRRTTIQVAVMLLVMGAFWVGGPIYFADKDDPSAIDSEPVYTAVAAACNELRSELSAIPTGLVAPEKAEAETRAAEKLVATVRSVGPDALAGDWPVERWLGDWQAIIDARREAVREGKLFAMPIMKEGQGVDIRMQGLTKATLSQCDVPPALLAPEPGRSGSG